MILNADSKYSGGLGDCVAMCWLNDPSITFYTKDPNKRIILDMLCRTRSDDFKNAIEMSPAFEREKKELAVLPRWQYWVEHINRLDIVPSCPAVSINQFDLDWASNLIRKQQTFLSRMLTTERKLVLLFPQSSQNIRMWLTSHWMNLSEMIYAAGLMPLVCFSGDELDGMFRYSLKGAPLDRLAALMKICSLTITPDSFPAHLASTIGCPTLTLWGPSKPESVFGHCLDRINIMRVTSDLVKCVGCNNDKKLVRPACAVACEALVMLQPKVVLEKALEIMQ